MIPHWHTELVFGCGQHIQPGEGWAPLPPGHTIMNKINYTGSVAARDNHGRAYFWTLGRRCYWCSKDKKIRGWENISVGTWNVRTLRET